MRLELSLYYLLFSLVTSVALLALRRRGLRKARLRQALLGLLVMGLVGGGLSLIRPDIPAYASGVWQLLAWGLFLWGAIRDWRVGSAAFLLLVALALIPGSPAEGLLSWGLLTAVVLTLYHTLTNQPAATIPIYAPGKTAPYRQPAGVRGDISAEAVQSQRPILECLTDGLILSGNDGHILYVNQAAAFIIGQEAPALVGRPITDILTHLPMLANRSVLPGNDGSSPRDLPERFEMNDRIIQGRMTILYNHDGVAQGTIALLRDITREHQAEQSRDAFLATISHELRTPLTAIKGYTELLHSGAGGSLNENQHTFLKTIQRNVSRMVHLINSLIFASAVKSGRLEFTSDHTSVPQIIQQIVRELSPRAAANGQQIQVVLDDEVGLIQADPMHVATILEELLSNAIKYNRSGGEIVLQAVLQADETDQQQFALVSIRDEGIGISPEDHQRIFEEFVHLDKDDTQVRAGGMGMGLTVVRALVETYNGRLWLESIPGEGSTFYFLLPVRQPDPGAFWPHLLA